MKYKLMIGDAPLYDGNGVLDGLRLAEPTLIQEANKAGELSFILPPTHELYDTVRPLQTIVKLYRDDEIIFKARVVDEKMDYRKTKTVLCEGALAFLTDSMIRPFDFSGSLEEFWTFVIQKHNSSVKPIQQFIIGDITVVDDYIHYSSINYLSAWEIFQTRLIDTHGGYIRVRYDESGKGILDYLSTFTDTQTHVVRNGENILNISQTRNAATTYTAIIPLGAKIESTDENGETTEHRLTIESVNAGVDYLEDTTLSATHGIIYAPTSETTWENVTIAANLMQKGQEYLSNIAVNLYNTLDIEAVKLYDAIGNGMPIRLYDKVEVMAEKYGITQTFLIKKITTKLYEPNLAKITLGEMAYSMLTQNIDWRRRVRNIERSYLTQDGAARVIGQNLLSNNAPLLEQAISQVVQRQRVSPSTIIPRMAGTEEIGSDAGFSRGDHRHPKDDTKADRVSVGVCSTDDVTQIKETSLTNFQLFNGVTIAVRFTYGNTANAPTLNVNGTGAAPIISCHTNATITTDDISVNMTAHFIYNGDSWILLNPSVSNQSAKV